MTRRDKVCHITEIFQKVLFFATFSKVHNFCSTCQKWSLEVCKDISWSQRKFPLKLEEGSGTKNVLPEKITNIWDYFKGSGRALSNLQEKKIFLSNTLLVDLKRSWSFFFITAFVSFKLAIFYWKQQRFCLFSPTKNHKP